MAIDDLTLRLANAMSRKTAAVRQEARDLVQRLKPGHIFRGIEIARQECVSISARLGSAMSHGLNNNRIIVEHLAAHLDGLSPLAVLARGYSITLKPDTGHVISDAATVQPGEDVDVQLHRGRLTCTVTDRKLEN